ncbi:hypothetical protein BU23DRAFT_568616 [Bimuria novae-zelandiae CBS 107.79]|uniref:Uncharacterized protein n=1 Tax=Bimuria novae-zelandiae CBS 107.79 TaxID=1447943 RepID=A0A6A5VIB2_9PLEO|nr:hypothetical protein BU23DRAFT_568616 [Bimuria novae-zelandiae CBS 107.79]
MEAARAREREMAEADWEELEWQEREAERQGAPVDDLTDQVLMELFGDGEAEDASDGYESDDTVDESSRQSHIDQRREIIMRNFNYMGEFDMTAIDTQGTHHRVRCQITDEYEEVSVHADAYVMVGGSHAIFYTIR